jgi:hypothetical protein
LYARVIADALANFSGSARMEALPDWAVIADASRVSEANYRVQLC